MDVLAVKGSAELSLISSPFTVWESRSQMGNGFRENFAMSSDSSVVDMDTHDTS
jgi:hypothetical protein